MEILNILIIISLIILVITTFNKKALFAVNFLIVSKFILIGNYFPILLVPIAILLGELYQDDKDSERNHIFLPLIKTLMTLCILTIGLWKFTYLGKTTIFITEKELTTILIFLTIFMTCAGVIKINEYNTNTDS